LIYRQLCVYLSMKKRNLFKEYNQNQAMLLPPSLEDFIPQGHVVRVVNRIINEIDLQSLEERYEGGGAASYHPRMLLKVLVYGYLNNIYSTRKLEESVASNVQFMWLAGMQTPDHNTISRFRTGKLREVCKEIFSQVVLMLVESGHMDLRTTYLDGTKIESKANRYTFIWGNGIKGNRERIIKQLEELWTYSEQLAKEELQDTKPVSFADLSTEQIRETLDRIHKSIKPNPNKDKKIAQKATYAKRVWPETLDRYQEQEELLAGRKSCSKTDPDASFMRMKEDHMRNGQLKPGYNVQVSGDKDAFIAHYSIHQTPADTITMIPHMESFETFLGVLPENQVADAGYGSESNLAYLEQRGVEAFVKYGYFDREQKSGNQARGKYHQDAMTYDQDRDVMICSMGHDLHLERKRKDSKKGGFLHEYATDACAQCPLQSACANGQARRVVEVNHNLRRLKAMAAERLRSEEGIQHRKRRATAVEGIFGTIKGNWNFRRFLTKGLTNVETEFGLLAIAFNLKKLSKMAV
jgi:transposase